MRLSILLLALPLAAAFNNELITTNELFQEGSRYECERRGGPGCQDTHFCDSDRTCSRKRGNGEACNEDFKCVSENCSGGICEAVEEPVEDLCARIRCSGKSYCDLGICIPINALLQNGQRCNSDTHCDSGFCNQNVCTEQNQNLADGEECDSNSQCQSGFCDRFVFEGSGPAPLSSNTNNPSLCQPKKENGDGCNDNFECISNICLDFECQAKEKPGSCSDDGDCSNGQFCNKFVFENSNTNNPSLCEDKRPNGEGCNGNNECQSNNCDDFECAAAGSQLPVDSCSRDNDCEDDEFCNQNAFEDSNTNNPSLCEEKRPNGEGCGDDNECQSDNCDDFECAAAGSSQPLLELGSVCLENSECESGTCFQGRRRKTCVPVEGEVGDYCVRNIHCASNRCRGRRGVRTCRAPRDVQVSRGAGTRLGDPSWYGW